MDFEGGFLQKFEISLEITFEQNFIIAALTALLLLRCISRKALKYLPLRINSIVGSLNFSLELTGGDCVSDTHGRLNDLLNALEFGRLVA